MMYLRHYATACVGTALLIMAGSGAWAQSAAEPSRLDLLERDASSLFDSVFGRNTRASRAAPRDSAGGQPAQMAQASPADMILRIERLENQVRQLTGIVEQLQFRNQQLEHQAQQPQQPRAMQNAGAVSQTPAVAGRAGPPTSPMPDSPRQSSDAFDPTQNPDAPGAPRPLGALPSGTQDAPRAGGERLTGSPLDLAPVTGRVVNEPSGPAALPGPTTAPSYSGGLPPPPPRNPNATGAPPQHMVMAPSNAPKDELDLARGYLQRKDYALAEESFRAFLKKYPSDRLAAEASYGLGESLYQRRRYREAAESFLNVSTKFETSPKAAESLLRLGQSLAALKEKEAACATLAEVGRKYPRASPSVRQDAERELKRAGC